MTPEPIFLRGDANWNVAVDIGDSVKILRGLFGSAGGFDCPDAADANDDGFVDIGDAIKVLSHLFSIGGSQLAPAGVVGSDPTEDGIGCEGEGAVAKERVSHIGAGVMEESQIAVLRHATLCKREYRMCCGAPIEPILRQGLFLLVLLLLLFTPGCLTLSVLLARHSEQRTEFEGIADCTRDVAIDFESAPAGAEVEVDGRILGQTPLKASFPLIVKRQEEVKVKYRAGRTAVPTGLMIMAVPGIIIEVLAGFVPFLVDMHLRLRMMWRVSGSPLFMAQDLM